jgi:hypothetical protein
MIEGVLPAMDIVTSPDVLGCIVMAAVAAAVCVLIVRELVIASVPEFRRLNRRRML